MTGDTQTWGQQCSPNCGCVVRFESKVDPATGIIVDATYHAKSVVVVSKNNRLEPLYTMRTNKPMLKECKCKSVHTLAKEITTFVHNKNIDRIRNLTEFTFTRSSPAFRHTVLVENGLSRNDTHCFDLIEEAFTAMLKGFIPSPRRERKSFQKLLEADFMYPIPDTDDDIASSPAKRPRRIRARIDMSTPRTMSALRAFDINAENWENEHRSGPLYKETPPPRKSYNWLSFVDERYRLEDEKAQ